MIRLAFALVAWFAVFLGLSLALDWLLMMFMVPKYAHGIACAFGAYGYVVGTLWWAGWSPTREREDWEDG